MIQKRISAAIAVAVCVIAFSQANAASAAAKRELTEEQLQQLLKRFPDADLNKDGKLTVDEAQAYLRKRKSEEAPETSVPNRPAAATNAPATATSAAPLAAPVPIVINSDKPVPVNPRVYGTWCEEMFLKDLVDDPEYIAALVDLKFKTFLYPGGSISYYHHPKGTGGFNIRREEVRDRSTASRAASSRKDRGRITSISTSDLSRHPVPRHSSSPTSSTARWRSWMSFSRG